MAPTFKAGNKTFLKLAKSGSTMILTSGVDASDIQRQADTYETTTYGDTDRSYIPGFKNGTLKFSGPFASTYETYFATALGATGYTLTHGPMTSAAGNPKLVVPALVNNYQITAPVGGRVSWNVDMMFVGPVVSTKF